MKLSLRSEDWIINIHTIFRSLLRQIHFQCFFAINAKYRAIKSVCERRAHSLQPPCWCVCSQIMAPASEEASAFTLQVGGQNSNSDLGFSSQKTTIICFTNQSGKEICCFSQASADETFSQILLFSARVTSPWSKLLLCVLLLPVVVVLLLLCLCSAFSARLKIQKAEKLCKVLVALCCAQQAQREDRNSD